MISCKDERISIKVTSLIEVNCRMEVKKTERSVYVNHIKILEIRKRRMKRWKIGER